MRNAHTEGINQCRGAVKNNESSSLVARLAWYVREARRMYVVFIFAEQKPLACHHDLQSMIRSKVRYVVRVIEAHSKDPSSEVSLEIYW